MLHVPAALLRKGPACLLENCLVGLTSWSGRVGERETLGSNTNTADRSQCVVIMSGEYGFRVGSAELSNDYWLVYIHQV